MVRKMNAMLSFYMHIPFPEKLDDEAFIRKWEELTWVLELDLKLKNTNDKNIAI